MVLVDDLPIVRKGLAFLFGKEPDLEVCGEAESETEGLERILGLKPDLAVVALGLKKGSGMGLIKRLRSHCPEVKILVFSMFDQPHFVARALAAGAHGYVTKAQDTEEVLEAVRLVMGGKCYLSREMAALTKRLGPGPSFWRAG